jgi:5-methylcytosine-specific restriction enzyme A
MKPRPGRLTMRPTQRIGLGSPPQGTVDPYLRSRTHEAWSAAVLKRAGYRCEATMPNGTRCPKTQPPSRLHADHVVERRDNSDRAADLANGMCLCVSHHVAKTLRERARRLARG